MPTELDPKDVATFAAINQLSDAGLIAYALAAGIKLEPQPRKDLLSKCASIFLSKKKSTQHAELRSLVLDNPAPAPAPKKEAPAPAPKKEAPAAVAKKKEAPAPAAKNVKSKDDKEKSESFTAACGQGQDFPRCPYCGTAITSDTGVRDGNNKPVCKECADKVNKSKEEVMKDTTKAKKTAAKKTASTKTGHKGKGNTDALKKAREGTPKDAFGFREGSNTSKVVVLLHKGATMEALKKISSVAPKIMIELKGKMGDSSTAREAVITHDEKTGVYKMKSFKLPK